MNRIKQVDNTYGSIWRISVPIIIGLIAQNLMVVIDTAFLGRLGEVALGAAAIGGIFYLCLVMFGAGFSVGTQIIIGRRNGEGRLGEIGKVFDHALLFVLLLALVLCLFTGPLATRLISLLLQSEAVGAETITFLSVRRYGFFFGFTVLVFNGFYTGITRTRLLIASTSLMAVVNIILDYALIFGHFGLPAMGIAGAALATNLAEAVTLVFFVLCTRFNPSIRAFRLFTTRSIQWVLYGNLFRVAAPIMFQYFFSFAAWFVFFLIIEQISETALAASNITRSVYMLLMIPVWGLSVSTKTLVSNLIGQGRADDVIPLVKKVMRVGILSTSMLVLITWLYPYQIVYFFTEEAALAEATLPLIRMLTPALLCFAFGMILFSGLSGTGKTLMALVIEISSIVFYLGFAFILAVFLNASAATVWLVEAIYFSVLGLLSYLYLKGGRWRGLRI